MAGRFEKQLVILNGARRGEGGAVRSESLTLRGRRRSGERRAPSLPPPPPIYCQDCARLPHITAILDDQLTPSFEPARLRLAGWTQQRRAEKDGAQCSPHASRLWKNARHCNGCEPALRERSIPATTAAARSAATGMTAGARVTGSARVVSAAIGWGVTVVTVRRGSRISRSAIAAGCVEEKGIAHWVGQLPFWSLLGLKPGEHAPTV